MPPPRFSVSLDIQVRFRDTDAMGHVNNAVYLSYLELARMHYWRVATGLRDFRKVDIILARAEVDYRWPATVDTELVCWVRVGEIGRSSFTMEYRLEEKGTGRLALEAKTVQVFFDYAANRVKRVPPEFARQVTAVDGG